MVVRRKAGKATNDQQKGEEKQRSFVESAAELNRPFYAHKDSKSESGMFWIAVGLSQLFGAICIGLVIYWCEQNGGFAWTSDAELQFNYHPLLMVLGLVFFYGDAIILYRVLSWLPKKILKLIHAVFHMLAIIFSSLALAAVFENHRRLERADMYSLHSWVGITTFSFFCFQYIGSFIAFLYPGIPMAWRAKMMPFHTFIGTGLFILAIATAEMGITEKLLWTENYTLGTMPRAGAVGNSLGLMLIVFGFLIVFIVTHDAYKRKPLPSEVSKPVN